MGGLAMGFPAPQERESNMQLNGYYLMESEIKVLRRCLIDRVDQLSFDVIYHAENGESDKAERYRQEHKNVCRLLRAMESES